MMSPKPKTQHPELPPRMVPRSWETKKGVNRAYYYEHPRDEAGKRKLEPLGTDFAKAKQKWGEIEGVKVEVPEAGTLEEIYQKYIRWAEKRDVSKLSFRTIKDRKSYWNRLGPVYGHIPINKFKASWFHDYFEKRSSKVGAKKEIKFISTMFTWAISRGYCDIANPLIGQTRLMKTDEYRKILITDHEFNTVSSCAAQALQDLMETLYTTGTRPTEAISLKLSEFNKHNELLYSQGKTAVKKRLTVNSQFKKLVARRRSMVSKAKVMLIDPPLLFTDEGEKLKLGGNVRKAFKEARDEAQKIDPAIRRFQLRDIRPHAATEVYRRHGLEETRKFLGHTTTAQTVKYIRQYLGELSETLEAEKTEDGESKNNYGESS